MNSGTNTELAQVGLIILQSKAYFSAFLALILVILYILSTNFCDHFVILFKKIKKASDKNSNIKQCAKEYPSSSNVN